VICSLVEAVMAMSATQLRANVYKVLDEAIATGQPVEIERKGVVLQLVPPPKKKNIFKFPPEPSCIIGDPEDIVHIDWSEYWNPDIEP